VIDELLTKLQKRHDNWQDLCDDWESGVRKLNIDNAAETIAKMRRTTEQDAIEIITTLRKERDDWKTKAEALAARLDHINGDLA
jgi:hypothetical protein